MKKRSAPHLPARRVFRLAALLGLIAAATAPLSAADLVVEGSNSPYEFTTGSVTYGTISVGQTANGTLNQSGGTLKATTLSLGVNVGVSGTYNLKSGTLTAAISGGKGTSTFNFNGGTLLGSSLQGVTTANVQTGGAIINTTLGDMTLSQSLVHDTTSGAPAIDGGLTATGLGHLILTGANTYTGPTTVNTGSLIVGTNGSLGSGNIILKNGNSTTAALQFYQSGTTPLVVGGAISGGGNLIQQGSNVVTLSGASTYTGNTTVQEGTLSLTGSLQSGKDATLTVDYVDSGIITRPAAKLSLSGGAILSMGTAYVGNTSVGTVDQTGGSFTTTGSATATGSLTLGNTASGNGTYNLVGSASTLSTGILYVGKSGTGTFTQTGGTVTIPTSGSLYLGNSTGSSGTYIQNGSGLSDSPSLSTGAAYVGYSGSGTFTQSNGSFDTNGRGLYLGYNSGSTGTYTQNAVLSALNAGVVYVGYSGSGTFNASAGGFGTGGNNLYLGYNANSSGTLNLSGGSVGTTNVYVGYGGTGTLNQSASSFTLGGGGNLYLGNNAGSNGTYNLSGSTSSLSTNIAYVGYNGTGTFNQSAGSLTASNTLHVSYNAGSSGTFNLSGGTLTSGRTQVGDDANSPAAFTQTGGLHTTGTLGISGYSTGSQGTYTLTGGLLNVGSVTNNNGNVAITGTSTFHFAGGVLQAQASTATFMQGLTVADVQGGVGAIIDTQGFNLTVGQNLVHDTTSGASPIDGGLTKLGSGTLTLSGTNTFTGPLTISAGTLVTASESSLGGGRTITVSGGGTLQFTGSTTLARTYNLGFSTLGAASGQTLTFGSGAIVNGGYLAGPGTDTLGSGSTLNAVTLQTGGTLAQTDGGAATLNNVTVRGTLNQTSGTLAFNNALVLGSGRVTVGGVINATGTEIQGVTTVNNGGTLATSGSSLYLTGGSRTTVNARGTLKAAGGATVELNGSLLVNNGTQTGGLNVNYGSTAKGTGTFGTVNVADGGRFGVNASSSGTVVNGLSVVHLTGTNGLASTAFVGPQLMATPGTANVASLALGSGSVFAFSVQDAQGTAGSGYDLAHSSGSLTLAAGTAAGSQITVSVVSLNASGTMGQAANFDPIKNYSFVLVQADGGITGYQADEFVVDASGFQNSANGGSFSVVQMGNNLDLLFTSAVPEPSTWALLVVGATGLAFVVRRRYLVGV